MLHVLLNKQFLMHTVNRQIANTLTAVLSNAYGCLVVLGSFGVLEAMAIRIFTMLCYKVVS